MLPLSLGSKPIALESLWCLLVMVTSAGQRHSTSLSERRVTGGKGEILGTVRFVSVSSSVPYWKWFDLTGTLHFSYYSLQSLGHFS